MSTAIANETAQLRASKKHERTIPKGLCPEDIKVSEREAMGRSCENERCLQWPLTVVFLRHRWCPARATRGLLLL